MPRSALLLCVAVALPVAALAQGDPRAAGESHPLIGKWRWTVKPTACTETYDFRTDGTAQVVSGDERSDNTFTVSRQPDGKGFYKLDMTITKDHGGKDCTDAASDDTGQHHTNYILFEPSREMYISCADATLDKCFGPLKRIGTDR